jgi:hypothetical protein
MCYSREETVDHADGHAGEMMPQEHPELTEAGVNAGLGCDFGPERIS